MEEIVVEVAVEIPFDCNLDAFDYLLLVEERIGVVGVAAMLQGEEE